tara:strand:+ start:503 stop:709 length:207 start_codon:yes stop_codon:yes gene_type:complete
MSDSRNAFILVLKKYLDIAPINMITACHLYHDVTGLVIKSDVLLNLVNKYLDIEEVHGGKYTYLQYKI